MGKTGSTGTNYQIDCCDRTALFSGKSTSDQLLSTPLSRLGFPYSCTKKGVRAPWHRVSFIVFPVFFV